MHNNKDLMDKLTKISLLLRKSNFNRNLKTLGDPCRGQSRVLSLLKSHPEINQKELSNLLGIRSQSLGELLVKLERNGYITRTQSDSDRRILDIKLTAEGVEAANRLEKSQQDSVRLFDCFDLDDKDRLSALFDKLIDGLEKETADGYEPEEYEACRKSADPNQSFFHRGGRHYHHEYDED